MGNRIELLLLNPPHLKPPAKMVDIPRLAIGYLAGYTREQGIKTSILDSKVSMLNVEDTIKKITEIKPAYLGITAMTHEIKVSAEIAEGVKKIDPSIKIIVGGAHPTVLPKATLEEFPSFDVCVIGDGEETLEKLVKSWNAHNSIENIPGIAFHMDGDIRKNENADYGMDLDHLALPAWDLYPPASEYPIISSRGCPFRCNFCCRINGNISRFRTPEKVVDEFEVLVEKYQAKLISFKDETLTLRKSHVLTMCKEICKRGLHRKVKWKCGTRVDCSNEEILTALKDAGCYDIEFGVESGNEQILKQSGKNIKLPQVLEAVKLAKKLKFKTRSLFILGHPYETPETLNDTIKFAGRLATTYVSFGIMVPYPGTEIYDMALKGEGGYLLRSHDWNDFDKYLGDALEFKHVSRKQLELAQVKAYFYFYIVNFRIFPLLHFIWSKKSAVIKQISKLVKPGKK